MAAKRKKTNKSRLRGRRKRNVSLQVRNAGIPFGVTTFIILLSLPAVTYLTFCTNRP